LVSITNNPSLYDPYTHPEKNAERRGYVLEWMCTEGYISERERDEAKRETLEFHSADSTGKTDTNYSWYTEQVITDVMNDFINRYGYSETVAHNIVYSGGLKIYACIDPRVQAAVDEIYNHTENLPYTSASGAQLQSAIVVVDASGNVAGLSGKMGEKTSADIRGWNRASMTTRQPGSSIKPLAVYAPALEMGLITPYSVFEDSPPMVVGGSPWPSNVTRRYLGQMTVNYAVANSTNTVAVRVLEQVTPEVAYEYLVEKFGVDADHLVVSRTINGQEYSDIGYSQMALGGLTDGVSPLDMAGAYSVFPRDGVYIRPRTYSKVEDSNGKEVLSNQSAGTPVLKEKTTYYINEMLQDVVSDGGGGDAYFSGMTIAGKTGSTTSNNDRWFVGYTPYYTAAVWVGYDIPERVTAGSGNPAAKLWSKVMSLVHEGLENRDFTQPGNLVWTDYCKDTGRRATELCEKDVRGSRVAGGYVFPEDVPAEYCDAHKLVEVCNADPVCNDNGEPTGLYHMAGEFCPEIETGEEGEPTQGRLQVSLPDLRREYLGGVRPGDDMYLLSSLEQKGTCTIHTQAVPETPVPYDPALFDITDPSTWPTKEDDPYFDPSSPSTWPNIGSPATAQPSPPPPASEDPVASEPVLPTIPIASSEPSLPVITPPVQTLPPEETPVQPTQDDVILPPP